MLGSAAGPRGVSCAGLLVEPEVAGQDCGGCHEQEGGGRVRGKVGQIPEGLGAGPSPPSPLSLPVFLAINHLTFINGGCSTSGLAVAGREARSSSITSITCCHLPPSPSC